jgi:outer membrane protein assembly factor BamC
MGSGKATVDTLPGTLRTPRPLPTFHYPLIMKTKIGTLIVIAVILANVPACSTIKNLFPDKEKDYQFTTEIPPLTLPADLGENSILNTPVAAPVAEAAEDVAPADEPVETEPVVERKLIQVDLVKSDEGASRLRIDAPLAGAWRMVGKALSRNSIEVTSRNQEEGLLHVQYDPDVQKVEDGSLWDEIAFVFRGFKIGEKEYVLKLAGNKQQTEVMVMDTEHKPLTEGPGLKLLTLLHDTIKADLAN